MTETAREALDRAARALTDPVAAEAGMRLASELEPGCAVKVHGEWHTFVRLEDDGHMHLDWGGGGEFYMPNDGERFVWF